MKRHKFAGLVKKRTALKIVKEAMEMRSKHTPGPWEVNGVEYGFNIEHNANGTIKELPVTQSNASLISAAPELLEAAKCVVQVWESGSLDKAVRKLALAIAKAEGRDDA